jgi:ribosomal 50S subunit-associated protein YjgA (DUF615 family)
MQEVKGKFGEIPRLFVVIDYIDKGKRKRSLPDILKGIKAEELERLKKETLERIEMYMPLLANVVQYLKVDSDPKALMKYSMRIWRASKLYNLLCQLGD